jgi:two-component system chemotaxis sensor kinase CheA
MTNHKTFNIVISDDGRGLDLEKIKKKALEMNLISLQEASELSDFEISQLIFSPGFSTKDTVSELSGRGVGLDALKSEVLRLGGRIMATSTPLKGTIFYIELPILST